MEEKEESCNDIDKIINNKGDWRMKEKEGGREGEKSEREGTLLLDSRTLHLNIYFVQ